MLEPGKTLSRYRLVELIGKGGMGEVWSATDVRLDRQVALKILPEVVTRDQSRLDRFAREAKLLASLNHAGIATIHDVDEHEGVRFLVMELVPGEDLAQTLERGPLPLADALDAALQIARAVEAAHGQGVVHRDLKPANVKRMPDGQIKVLDFGLAKTMEPEPASGDANIGMSPTMTSAGTVAGMILGTAAYMSPEQARARPIDKRTDVWSFGVLFFELLTGDNPFRGDTVADSVGAIMHRDPDLDALPPETPAAIRRLLRRCLARERSHRLHDIADARIEIEEAIAHPEVERAPVEAEQQVVAPPSRLPWIALAVLVPLVAVLAWWVGSREDPPTPEPTRRFKLVADAEVETAVVSPDGTRIAYKVANEIFIRSLDALDARVVAGDDVGQRVTEIFWAPDGQALGLVGGTGEIRRFDLAAGAPTVLTADGGFIRLAVWGDDGFVYFPQMQGGIGRVPDTGGALEIALEPQEGMIDYHGFTVLPGGGAFLTLPHLVKEEHRTIFVEAPGEVPRAIHTSDSLLDGLMYSPTEHVLFYREDNPRGLWALPFSVDRLEATGAPFLVAPDLDGASFSNDGDMVYPQSAVESGGQKQQIVWADRSGKIVDRLDVALYGSASNPIVSPDGSMAAVLAKGVGRPSTGKVNLWVIDLARRSSTRLTEGRIIPSAPMWSPDGARIAFLSEPDVPGDNPTLVSVRADGTGGRETVLEADMTFFVALNRDWSWAAFMTGAFTEDSGFSIAAQRPGDTPSLRTFVDSSDQDVAPAIHPDGNWLAYMSGTPAAMHTFVRPFPEGEGQWKVSTENGSMPFWSPDGRALYYVHMDRSGKGHLMEVSFDGSGARPVLGTPVELFENPDDGVTIAPDGRFVYFVKEEPAEGEEAPDTKGIVLVENWLTRFIE